MVMRAELEEFISSDKKPTPTPTITVRPDIRMAEVEDILETSPLKTVFLTTKSGKFLGLFTHTDVTRSQDKEKEIEES